MQLTAVIEAAKEIPELGIWVGDRLVIRPWHPTRPFVLQRALPLQEARRALRPGVALLLATLPPLPPDAALRTLQAAVPPTPASPHLRLLP